MLVLGLLFFIALFLLISHRELREVARDVRYRLRYREWKRRRWFYALKVISEPTVKGFQATDMDDRGVYDVVCRPSSPDYHRPAVRKGDIVVVIGTQEQVMFGYHNRLLDCVLKHDPAWPKARDLQQVVDDGLLPQPPLNQEDFFPKS